MRASEDGASTAPPCYAACNAPASRSDGALLAHCTSALGTHPVAAALKRAPPCERLVSGSTPNKITSCQATLARSFRYSVFEIEPLCSCTLRISVRHKDAPPTRPFARVLHHRAPCGGIIPPHPLARVLCPRAPMLFVYSSFERPFCQGTAPKKFAREARKIFRALDNDVKLK